MLKSMKMINKIWLVVLSVSLMSCSKSRQVEYEGGEINPITSETVLHDDVLAIGDSIQYIGAPQIKITLFQIDVSKNKAAFKITKNSTVEDTVTVSQKKFIKSSAVPELKGIMLQKINADSVILTGFEAR
jgi:hypothetical protein